MKRLCIIIIIDNLEIITLNLKCQTGYHIYMNTRPFIQALNFGTHFLVTFKRLIIYSYLKTRPVNFTRSIGNFLVTIIESYEAWTYAI